MFSAEKHGTVLVVTREVKALCKISLKAKLGKWNVRASSQYTVVPPKLGMYYENHIQFSLCSHIFKEKAVMCFRQHIQFLFNPQKWVSGFQVSKLDKNQTHCSANIIYW